MATPTAKKIEVNGKTFQLNRIPLWTAVEIQGSLVGLLGPALSGLDGKKGSNFDMAKAATAAGASLLAAADQGALSKILSKLLAPVVWYPGGPEPGPRELNQEANIEDAFAFDMETMYRVAIAQMEHNRFPFFEKLAAIGRRITETSGSGNQSNPESETEKS